MQRDKWSGSRLDSRRRSQGRKLWSEQVAQWCPRRLGEESWPRLGRPLSREVPIQTASNTSVSATPGGVPGSWLQPGPSLSVAGIWRVNQGLEDLVLSVHAKSVSQIHFRGKKKTV